MRAALVILGKDLRQRLRDRSALLVAIVVPLVLASIFGLIFHNAIGGKRKEARLRYLSRYWMNRLKDVPKIRFNTSFDPNQSCAIANVHIGGTNPEAVTKYLFDKHHIFAVPIMHEEFQGIRITPNIYSTFGELDRFCEQMEQIARKGLPT